MIIFPPLYKKGFPQLHFVARYDLFLQGLPGFQQSYHPFIGALLFYVNMRKPMRLLNAHPIRKYETTTVRELLIDIKDKMGDFCIDDILTEKWNFLFYALRPGEDDKKLKISEVIKPHYNRVLKKQYRSLGSFLKDRDFREEVKDLERSIVQEQEIELIELLNEGGTLCLFPEGDLSLDGKLRKIKAGLHDVLKETKTNVRILPINITYDFMFTTSCLQLEE